MSYLKEIIGSNEERADELYRYLTAVKFLDLEREDFDELLHGCHDFPLAADVFLDVPILPMPEDNYKQREYWFKEQRSTYSTIFRSTRITDWKSQELKYNWLSDVVETAVLASPYGYDHEDPRLDRESMNIFVHGAGIGDEIIWLAKAGYKNIYYNDIGGSHALNFGLKRLEARGLYEVPNPAVQVSLDPLGRGIYEDRRAFEGETNRFDLIISCDVFGWIKHPMFTIMNLGRLMAQTGILAILPTWKGSPLRENEWMIAVQLLTGFMGHMGFKPIAMKDIYPVFKCLWVGSNKYKEEWMI